MDGPGPETDDATESNRRAFAAADVVGDYAAMTGLTPAEQLVFASDVPAGGRVLDLGVGTGRTTAELASGSARYVGIDIADTMIERARELHPGIDFRVGDASDLSAFGDASFDAVVFSYNGLDYLHPDERRQACLAEIARVLAPTGRFVFSVHNPRALLRVPERPLRPRSIAVAAYQTARRTVERLGSTALRRGDGYVTDRVRGGLVTHMAVPAAVIAETEPFGFRHRRTVPSDHPRRPNRLRTGWWYYSFERIPPGPAGTKATAR